MEPASPDSVIGHFDGEPRTLAGERWTPLEREGRFFFVAEDGQELEVAHTFGIDPLQQYLVRREGGRQQALPVAWDARPAASGGQRWLHLYAEAPPAAGDPLHWTGRDQTWNYQCAECHSTHLVRGYDAERDAYETRWAEIDVACEACHGPGSEHLRWAERSASARPESIEGAGLQAPLRTAPGGWQIAAGETIAARSGPASHQQAEIEVCAPCHSRRSPIADGFEAGTRFLDAYRPALLDPGLYYADGQIQDEVYVWGSFVQSRMHAAGVSCGDCHDPHSLELKRTGPDAGPDAVCAGCHLPSAFATPAHHGHTEGSTGASCVACHMPARTYMQVDARRDHSLRVPRPDLAVRLGTPDACSGCHADRDPAWAADALRARGVDLARRVHFAEAIEAGRSGRADAEARLAALLADASQPAIARATGARLLGAYLSARSIEPLRAALRDPDALVRLGALTSVEAIDPRARIAVARQLLRDPLRALRIEAARILAETPADAWRPADRNALADALAEYRAAQHALADRPESWLNLGLLHSSLGELAEAEAAERRALELAPEAVAPRVNLADLLRRTGRESEAERILRYGLERAPDSAPLHYALALSLVRSGARDEALALLRKASELDPTASQHAYAYALALQDAGRPDEAVATLERAHAGRPADREILFALASLERDRGDAGAALGWAQRLLEIDPSHRGAHALVSQLGAAPH